VPRTERYNRLSYFDIDAPSPIAGRVAAFPNLVGAMKFATPDHRRQTPTDTNNWGPRFGFAYQINSKTVFRGAYSILYSPSVLQASGTSGSSGTEGFSGSTNLTTSLDGGVTPTALLRNPYPLGFNRPPGPAGGEATNPAWHRASFFNDYVNPIVQQWNATGNAHRQSSFRVKYLATKATIWITADNMTYNQLPILPAREPATGKPGRTVPGSDQYAHFDLSPAHDPVQSDLRPYRNTA
jgi:hypothetical protein